MAGENLTNAVVGEVLEYDDIETLRSLSKHINSILARAERSVPGSIKIKGDYCVLEFIEEEGRLMRFEITSNLNGVINQ